MISCPSCSTPNAPGKSFCRKCGRPLEHGVGQAAADPVTRDARQSIVAQQNAPPRPIVPWKWLAVVALVVGAVAVGWLYRSNLRALAQAVSGREAVQQELTELQLVMASKDSLFDELMETTALITDISTAVSAIQVGRPGLAFADDEGGRPISTAAARRLILARIDSLRTRLSESESRMTASLDRMRALAGTQERLRAQLAEYERRIATMTELMDRQQSQLATLETDISTLRAENQRLSAERDEMAAAQAGLQGQVADLQDRSNTVYWIAGRKDDLKRLGVIEEVGGNFLGGRTAVPAPTLPVQEFIPLNRAQETELVLPSSGKRYRIVSRHNGALLSPAADRNRRVGGTLVITDPDAFWAVSPFLILVED